MSKFVLFEGSNQKYYFHLKADNGEKILASQGYTSKQSCQNGVTSVRTNSTDDSKYDKRPSSNGGYYFNLLAGNGEIIGTSETYTTASARDNGIAAVKRIAPYATVEDQTVTTSSY